MPDTCCTARKIRIAYYALSPRARIGVTFEQLLYLVKGNTNG